MFKAIVTRVYYFSWRDTSTRFFYILSGTTDVDNSTSITIGHFPVNYTCIGLTVYSNVTTANSSSWDVLPLDSSNNTYRIANQSSTANTGPGKFTDFFAQNIGTLTPMYVPISGPGGMMLEHGGQSAAQYSAIVVALFV